MGDNFNICQGLLHFLDEQDESSRRDISHNVSDEDNHGCIYSHLVKGLFSVLDEPDESSRIAEACKENNNGFIKTHIGEGLFEYFDEPNANSSICTSQEVIKEANNDWINSFLAEGSTISEGRNLIHEFSRIEREFVSYTDPEGRHLPRKFANIRLEYSSRDSEVAGGGHLLYGCADIDKLDYSSYADVLWEIVCKNCFFVSEDFGLEYHRCEQNENGNTSTKKLNHCEKCGLFLSNNETFEEHESSRKHILLLLNKKGDEYIDEVYLYYCSLCKVQTMTQSSFYNHITSEQHSELLTELYYLCDSYCTTCKLTLDKMGRDVHLSSKPHLIQSILQKNRFKALFEKESLAGKTVCEVCEFNCGKKKNYLDHFASIEHSIKEVNLLIANVDFTMYQYILALPNGYQCLPCDIKICSEYSLKVHCNIDDHICAVQKYEKHIEMLPTVITEDQTKITKRPYDIIGKTKRYIAHIYKNFEEYLEWKEIVVTDDYCYLCNTSRTESHELSKSHSEKSEMLFYCIVCDKTFHLKDKKHHLQTSMRHKNTISEYGPEGKPNKLGIRYPTWNCKVCDMSLSNNEKEKKDHLDSMAHRTNFDEYLNSYLLKHAMTYVNLLK